MEIEPRIKDLVDILNEVDYIKTISSCEGHYDSNDYGKQKANVIFELKDSRKEQELEKLMKTVLSETAKHWTETDVRFKKDYYMMPDDNELRDQYVLEITPFTTDGISSGIKRRNTDKAIKRITNLVDKYLVKYRK